MRHGAGHRVSRVLPLLLAEGLWGTAPALRQSGTRGPTNHLLRASQMAANARQNVTRLHPREPCLTGGQQPRRTAFCDIPSDRQGAPLLAIAMHTMA